MGQIISLRNEIEAIITAMTGCTYLRAHETEANVALNQLKVTDCLCIHIDRTEVTANVTQQHMIIKSIPTEILFVYKNTSVDDKQYDVDTLIDQAEDKADEFHDRLIQSALHSDLEALEDYELNRLEADSRFDAILSGVLYRYIVPVIRDSFTCVTT